MSMVAAEVWAIRWCSTHSSCFTKLRFAGRVRSIGMGGCFTVGETQPLIRWQDSLAGWQVGAGIAGLKQLGLLLRPVLLQLVELCAAQ
jgi:hypothetical protein